MAQPTQQLPPWYTASVTTLTDAAGNAVETSTSLLFLPLTYYGPSIPLDPAAWTYGGLSSPASSSSSPSPTSTASPSTSSEGPSSSVTSSSLTTSSSASVSPTSSSPSTSSTQEPPTPSPTLSGASHSDKNRNIAIISSIICVGILCLFLLMFCLFRRAQRRRRTASEGMRGTQSSVFTRSRRSPTPLGGDDYFVVDRESGDGSPRHSGEEADPFLRAHAPQLRQPPPPTHDQFGVRDSMVSSNPSNQQTMTSGTNESGYGTLIRDRFDETTPFVLGGRAEQAGEQDSPSSGSSKRGRILSPDDQQQISDESMILPPSHGHRPQSRWARQPPGSPPPDDDFFSASDDHKPLIPPPRLVEPTHRSGTPFFNSHNTSSVSFDEGEAALLTAQRVMVGSSIESAPRVIPVSQASSEAHDSLSKMPSSQTQNSDAGPSAWRRVTNFFTRQDSTSSLQRTSPESPTSASSPLLPTPGVMTQLRNVSDAYRPGDSSRPVSASITAPFAFLRRPHSASAALDRPRPISTSSSKGSGGTVYHDAREELWSSGSGKGSSHSTGSGKGTPHTGYPGEWGALATTSRLRGGDDSTYGSSIYPRADSPRVPPGLPTTTRTATPPTADKGSVDYLDSPPPAALSSFQPISVPAPSVTHARAPFFPPGLGTQRYAGGGLDVLEEEPPRATALWQTHVSAKRSTFGSSGQIDLEANHLGVIRSHELYPNAAGSSATDDIRTLSPTHLAPSRRMQNDSNPTSDSYSSVSAVSMALSHSGSVTSDGRLRRQENSSNSQSQGSERGPQPACLSAFGSRAASRAGTPAPGHSNGGSDDSTMPALPPSVSGPPLNLLIHSPGNTSASATLAGTPHTGPVSLQEGTVPDTAGTHTDSSGASVPLEDFPDVPWATGLDKDWKAR